MCWPAILMIHQMSQCHINRLQIWWCHTFFFFFFFLNVHIVLFSLANTLTSHCVFHLKLDCCKAVGNEHQSRALSCLFSIMRANVCWAITLAILMLKASLAQTCWTGFWYQGYGPPHIQHLLDVFLISHLQFCSYSANVKLSFLSVRTQRHARIIISLLIHIV